ncbi:5-oxoprolinase subunit PxpA [Arthrobacter tecti]
MREPVPRIDLNADLGEGFGAWTMGDDAAMFPLVSSANIACGFHGGDPATMLASCRLAVQYGVAIGAHVAYRDLAGFGRRYIDIAPEDLAADVLYQLAALDGIARSVGGAVAYVKPHGALYNRIVHDGAQAGAVLAAVRSYNPGLPILGLPDSQILQRAEAAGQPTAREAFADRNYEPDGTLTPRKEQDAVLGEPETVAGRALRMVSDGVVIARDGTRVPLDVASICVHGDTPGAVAMAGAVREQLLGAGVEIRSFV